MKNFLKKSYLHNLNFNQMNAICCKNTSYSTVISQDLIVPFRKEYLILYRWENANHIF